MTLVRVVLEYPGPFLLEETFSDKTTIAAIKDQICCGYLGGQDVQILAGDTLLEDSSTLADIPPMSSNRLLGRKSTLKLNIRVSIPELVSPSAQDSIETTSSYVTSANVPSRLLEVFEKPNEDVVDELFRSMSGAVDRKTLCSLLAPCLAEATSLQDAVQLFYGILCEYGLNHIWTDASEQLHEIRADVATVFPSRDEASPNTKTTLLGGSDVCATQEEAAPSSSETFTCVVCSEEHLIEVKFVVLCEDNHELCYDCATGYLQTKIDEGIAKIQCFALGCEHEMSPVEIALALGHGDFVSGQRHPLFLEVEELQLNFLIANNQGEYCTCPREGCTWTVARSEKGAIEKVTCGDCSTTFCSNCRDMYHYRTSCIECQQIRRAWQSWVVSGRSEYWRLDKEMHQKARQTAEAEKSRIVQITKAEALDEEHKARTCRHCPHCDRLVEKLGGCDLMRCGYDVDTKGNVQNGCKSKFLWSEARPYKPVEAGKLVKPVATKGEEKALHEGWRCDQCGEEEIRGLRFECVNCPSWYICERCDNDIAHSPGHVFRIHTAS